eukprot:gene5454-6004_t
MDRILRATTTLGAGAIVAGVVSDFFLFDVDAGTRAVIFDKLNGLQEKVVGEGTHFRIPYLQVPIIMDVRDRPRQINSITGTKDLQMVNISLRVLSRPEEQRLPVIYRTLGTDFDDRILPSLGNEVLKAVVAQYNAEELLSKRAIVSKGIRDALVERASKFGLILDDVSITHLTFGREFAKAIEHKQVAQQEAETQAYVVQKADQERKAAIIRAEGEAEAAELISKAMSAAGNGFIEVRRIDTAKEVASTLSRSSNVVYLPSSGSNGQGSGSNLLLSVGK